MALTPQEQQRLADLKAALARVGTGGEVTKITTAGRSIEKTKSDPAELRRQIEDLECLATSRRRRGAIGFRLF